MRIKGLAKIQKQLNKIRTDLENKICDNQDRCGTVSGDRVDSRLNDAWMIIDSAINELLNLGDI